MTAQEIRKAFLNFFEKRGHKIVPSSSLIPDDPSVLLTTAGMQQFKPYYIGKADALKDFGLLNVVSVQKSFRTSDIDEVGDESHLTFFEMLGNFSFGGYFKKDAIRYAYDFFKEIGLSIEFVTVFWGDSQVPADEESEKIWREFGITDIRRKGREDNFWGPTGSEGPCGPTTEIYINGIEIWNIVFNEYYYQAQTNADNEAQINAETGLRKSAFSQRKSAFVKLEKPGVDTGMGLERLAMVLQKKKNIFETDLFASLFALFPQEMPEREKRIVADHIRGAFFLLADGVRPSNKDRGYILRRLLRRVFVYESQRSVLPRVSEELLSVIVREYGWFYPELAREQNVIREEFSREREKFSKTISRGLKELEKMSDINPSSAFNLYETYGIPYEVIKEFGGERAKNLTSEGFNEEFKKHQEISRAGIEKKFGGHGLLLNTGELKAADEEELKKVTRLHTATHLLNAALRKVLNDPNIRQNGSDITAERTRFDFSFPRKLTQDEIKKVEDAVNEVVAKNMEVVREEMPYADAVASGALHFFREKYPEQVSVYTVRDAKTGEVFSKELCGGPHVSRTGEIGCLKIIKEESSSAGVRRIRAVVE